MNKITLWNLLFVLFSLISTLAILFHSNQNKCLVEIVNQKHNETLEVTQQPNSTLIPYIRLREAQNHVNLSYSAMMNLSSSYDARNSEFDYTVIISGWRRPQYISDIIHAFQIQDRIPKEIWVSVFASPKFDEYNAILMEVKKTIPIHIIVGDPQLSYWARFQLALQVKTKYVVIVDDDCVPGKQFLSSVLYMMHTQYHGLYGIKGNRYVDSKFHISGQKSGDYLQEVDVVGGMWIAKSSWIKYMFYEEPISWLTSEDSQLSYALRKYLNLPSFIYPSDFEKQETKPVNTQYTHISFSGDTTDYINDGRKEMRGIVVNKLWKKGLVFSSKPKQLLKKNIVLFMVNDSNDMTHFSEVILFLKNNSILYGFVYSDTLTYESIKYTDSISELLFNVELLKDNYKEYTRDIDLIAQALYSMQQILENIRPITIGMAHDTSLLFATAQVIDSLNTPLILWEEENPSRGNKMKFISSVATKVCNNTLCVQSTIKEILFYSESKNLLNEVQM
jgi:hypothetical protein